MTHVGVLPDLLRMALTPLRENVREVRAAEPIDFDCGVRGVGIVHVWVNGSWQARGSAYLWKTWYVSNQDQGAVFLTAKHVLACATSGADTSINVSLGTLSAIASGVWAHPSKDLVVLWFRKAYEFNGRRTTTRQFYKEDWAALRGSIAWCHGYGKEHARPSAPVRSSQFLVEDVLYDASGCPSALALRAAGDSAFLSGDSGGACMVEGRAGQGLTLGGIITAGGRTATAQHYASATILSANDREWLSRITQSVC